MNHAHVGGDISAYPGSEVYVWYWCILVHTRSLRRLSSRVPLQWEATRVEAPTADTGRRA